ncbi:hypothetical protein [Chitinivorax sp. B]|uniref:hypothetical protein n=1 Tax=Chitinivorax sp. B TaxID=2502235 RepID=UPI0010F4B142|nr:hypothetical protein [Chitinivorax sp. B]
MRTYPNFRSTLFTLACLVQAPFVIAASDPWLPSPGEYQIDMTSTTRTSTPVGVIERIERHDGATGNTTVTLKSPESANPIVMTYPGKGPVRYCQIGYAAAPVSTCVANLTASGDSAIAQSFCQGQQQDMTFRKLGNGVWEKQIRVVPTTTPPMPANVATAMTPVIEKMEARIKVAPPAEAAALRQQLQSIKGAGTPAAGPEVESIQRWTLVSNHCSKKP